MKIYSIPFEIRQALEAVQADEETGEIINGEALDAVEAEASDKVLNCSKYIKEQEAEIEAMKAAADAIKARIKTKERSLEWLKSQTLRAIQAIGGKVESPEIRVSTRKSESVNIWALDKIAPEFMRTKTITEPDKKALKEAIKNGEFIDGADLVTNYSLAIK